MGYYIKYQTTKNQFIILTIYVLKKEPYSAGGLDCEFSTVTHAPCKVFSIYLNMNLVMRQANFHFVCFINIKSLSVQKDLNSHLLLINLLKSTR